MTLPVRKKRRTASTLLSETAATNADAITEENVTVESSTKESTTLKSTASQTLPSTSVQKLGELEPASMSASSELVLEPLRGTTIKDSESNFNIFFPDDYYNAIMDDSNYHKLENIEELFLHSQNTDIPLKVFPIFAYCVVELALSDLSKLGGTIVFTSPNFDQKCVDMLLQNSAFMNMQSTEICFGADKKVNEVVHILSRLNLAGVDPIYLISPVVHDNNVVSLMITDMKKRKIWSFEPGNVSTETEPFEKEIRGDEGKFLTKIYQETSLYTTYFMANCMIHKFEPREKTFNHSERFRNNIFAITRYLPKLSLFHANFVLLLVIQLLIQESKSFTRVRDGDLIMNSIIDVFRMNEKRESLSNFYLDITEVYNDLRKQQKKTVNKNPKIKFFHEVTNEPFHFTNFNVSTKLLSHASRMPGTSAIIFPPIEFTPNQLANKGFTIFRRLESHPKTNIPLLITPMAPVEETVSKPVVVDDEMTQRRMLIEKLKTIFNHSLNGHLNRVATSLLSFEVENIISFIKRADVSINSLKYERSNTAPYLNAFDRTVLGDVKNSHNMRSIFIKMMESWLNLDDQVIKALSKKRYNSLRGKFNRFTIVRQTNGDLLIEESLKGILSLENQIKLYMRVSNKVSKENITKKEALKNVVKAYEIEHGYKSLGNFNEELVEHIDKKIACDSTMADVSEDEKNNSNDYSTIANSCGTNLEESGSETSGMKIDGNKVLNQEVGKSIRTDHKENTLDVTSSKSYESIIVTGKK